MSIFIRKMVCFFTITISLYFSIIVFIVFLVQDITRLNNLNIYYPLGGNGFLNTRLKDSKQVKNVDILFLGASNSYRGFNPEVFVKHNFNTFNLGSSAQTHLQTYMLLNRYLDQLNPKMVIWAVSPVTFEFNGFESTVDIIANDFIDFKTVRLVVQTNEIQAYNTLVYGYCRQLFRMNSSFCEKLSDGVSIYMPKTGFSDRLFSSKNTWFSVIKRNYKKTPKQVKAFGKCLAVLKEKGIKTILVQLPIAQKEYISFLDNSEMDSLFSSYAPYINFNGIMNFNDQTDFYDPYHMNKGIVIKFNELLIDMLEKDGYLPNEEN